MKKLFPDGVMLHVTDVPSDCRFIDLETGHKIENVVAVELIVDANNNRRSILKLSVACDVTICGKPEVVADEASLQALAKRWGYGIHAL